MSPARQIQRCAHQPSNDLRRALARLPPPCSLGRPAPSPPAKRSPAATRLFDAHPCKSSSNSGAAASTRRARRIFRPCKTSIDKKRRLFSTSCKIRPAKLGAGRPKPLLRESKCGAACLRAIPDISASDHLSEPPLSVSTTGGDGNKPPANRSTNRWYRAGHRERPIDPSCCSSSPAGCLT